MSNYIKIEFAEQIVRESENVPLCRKDIALEKLRNLPIEDVAPVVHARWIDSEDEDEWYYANCSNCGLQIDTHEIRGYWNYCPCCGAKMDGKEQEK